MLASRVAEDTTLKEEIAKFNEVQVEQATRLDSFYFTLLSGKEEYKNLWGVVQLLLCLSHGQAEVERGFSINKETTAVNIKEKKLISRRAILDHLRHVSGWQKVNVDGEMILAASSARAKYQLHLEEKKKAAQSRKRKNQHDEEVEKLMNLTSRMSKKKRLEDDVAGLLNSVDKLAEKAVPEVTNSHKWLTESNALR